MNVEDILAAARQCLGTPFHHQGRLVGVALDCAGVAVHIASAIGIDYLDVPGYGRTPANGQLEQALDSQPCLEIVPAISGRLPGDLLLMRIARDPQHLAVLTDRETIIHAYESAGHCCEHLLDPAWRARIVRVYRFQGAS